MSRHAAGAARLYGVLLRRLVPSLGPTSTAEATRTFAHLWADAWSSGFGSGLAFVWREVRALLSTARQERRVGRRRGGAAQGLGAGGPEGSAGRPGRPGGGGLVEAVVDFFRWDVRLAVRSLARSPGFVILSVVSLTFGIGTATALFTVAESTLVRPASGISRPDQVVRIVSTTRGWGRGPSSYPDFEDYRRLIPSLADAAAFRSETLVGGTTSEATRTFSSLEVSDNFFDVLGTRLALGRGFLPEDVRAERTVAVIGYNVWRRDYGADPAVLGRTIRLNSKPYTIVGVAPRGMSDPIDPLLLDVVVPFAGPSDQRDRLSLYVVGRMKAGATLPMVRTEADAVARRLAGQYPAAWASVGHAPRGVAVLTDHQARMPEGATVVAITAALLAVVVLVLLIACSNVSNLFLSRALRRRSEVAVRSALGASGPRIAVQYLSESLLLFGISGGLGLLIAYGLARAVGAGLPALGFSGMDLGVDLRVVAFALGLALVSGLSFGLLPALHVSRASLVPALKGHGEGGRIRRTSLRSLLVAAQVAGSLVLVVVTLLLVRGLAHANTTDLGFNPRRVAILSVDLSQRGYDEAEARTFLQTLEERLKGLPGVQGVALGTFIPLQGGGSYLGGLEPEGYTPGADESVTAAFAAVSPGYLDVVGMHLLRGRDFGPQDVSGSPPVALVNQAFVDRYWPGERGVGQIIGHRGGGASTRVVGVVANVKYKAVDEDPIPHVWYPFAQSHQAKVVVHVRTAGDPRSLLPALRRQVEELDPELPVLRVDLMQNITDHATAPQRIISVMLGVTGTIAMALAMLGIYGVIGFSVSQRTREMGLRMAVGAHPRRVVGMVVREGVTLSLVGLVPGLALGVAASLALRSVLLGISPLSLAAFGGGTALLLLAAVAASLVPALRAARAHPVESLRVE